MADSGKDAQAAPAQQPDASGYKFDLPVDTEFKATKYKILSFAHPHMRSFHLIWFAFFIVFVSTFAPAALIPVIKCYLKENYPAGSCSTDRPAPSPSTPGFHKPDLIKPQLADAGIAAVVSAIISRVTIGWLCDVIGPRYACGAVMLLTAIPVFAITAVNSFGGFVAIRFFIGLGLSVFVTCQYWVGSMFNGKVVGSANAIAAGWGNMGGGFTLMIMPLVYEGFRRGGYSPYWSWRLAFVFPGSLHVLSGIMCLWLGQDYPQGQFFEIQAKKIKPKENGWNVLKAGLFNYRTWVMCITYGYCFGVELTVDNVIHTYYHDHFKMSLTDAGYVAASFGLMNLFTRASGGMISDLCAKYYGMRGRLWSMWIIQTLGGVFCCVLGAVDYSLSASIVVMIIFSVFCQQSCGLSFGIVPFITRRSYGIVSGLVGAGGNAGAATTQALFFKPKPGTVLNYTPQKGMIYMGIMIIAVTALYMLMWWPAWGGMFVGPTPGATEEEYYLSDYTAEEINQGIHSPSVNFAYESRSQRPEGSRKGAAAKSAAAVEAPVVSKADAGATQA